MGAQSAHRFAVGDTRLQELGHSESLDDPCTERLHSLLR